MKWLVLSTCLPLLLIGCSTHMDPRLEREAEGLIRHDAQGGQELTPQALQDFVTRVLLRTRKIRGYRCTIYKRERVQGELLGTQKARLDIRHEPFSVHIRFLAPSAVAGEEAIYVAGRYDDKIVAHSTGLLGWLGTVHLDPGGSMAMKGNRYPITDAGMLRLLEKFDAICRSGVLDHCAITSEEGVVLEGRTCVRVEVRNLHPRPDPGFSRIVLLVDADEGVLLHYEVQALQEGACEVLVERHTFTDVLLDPGLVDRDFDPENPAYGY